MNQYSQTISKISLFSIVAVILFVTLAGRPKTANGATLKPGTKAPEFKLDDETGKTYELSKFKGKIVVLEWTSTRCPFVLGHYERATMRGLEKSFRGKPVVWLAIDSSYYATPSLSKSWKSRWGVKYPILQDPSGKVGKAYHASTTPHMFVIDEKGILRYEGAIDDDVSDSKPFKLNYVDLAVTQLLEKKTVTKPTIPPYGCSVHYLQTK